MKKIILAFDGTNFSEGAFEFTRRLNELHPVLLTGVFIPQSLLANLWSFADSERVSLPVSLVNADEATLVDQNKKRFEKLCQGNNIDYRIHEDFYDLALPELRKESRYADLIILGSQVFFEGKGIIGGHDYLKDDLQDVKCPIILVPEKFDFPESIILAYDGSDNSVFAIKQFAYLFPEMTSLPTLLVYAQDDPGKSFPDEVEIEELTARHFSDLTLFKLEINPKKYFSTWIAEKKSAILVSGAYGRRGFPGLFKKSFIRNVINDQNLPVFIAHSR